MSRYIETTGAERHQARPVWWPKLGSPSVGHALIIAPPPIGGLLALLRDNGFTTEAADSGADALSRWSQFSPDIVILDLGCGGAARIAICQEVCERDTSPIVVLCDQQSDDIVEVLRAGADACLQKPVGHHELVARMRALLRRRRAVHRERPPDRLDEIRVDRTAREATVAGRPLDLSRREFETLATLVADCGTRVTRREALLEVDESPNTLDSVIRRVRTVLEAEEGWRRLVSVRGVGFRLLSSQLERNLDLGAVANG